MMAGLTVEQRFVAIEEQLNKIMEYLMRLPTMDDGAAIAEMSDTEISTLREEVTALEHAVLQLQHQVNIIKSQR